MQNNFLLEMCVESVDYAVAAERGGAHRIELCSNLAVGGVTPSPELIRAVRDRVRLPIHVMVRPRPGNFCYSEHEFETMQQEIVAAKQIGMDGIVLGILDPESRVDLDRTRNLVKLGDPLPVTFHRAFDETADLFQALETVIQAGARRILTSGGREGAVQGAPILSTLIEKAVDRVIIMPGGGVNESNVDRVMRQSSARELHSSLGGFDSTVESNPISTVSRRTPDRSSGRLALFEQRVQKLVELISRIEPPSEVRPLQSHPNLD